jgi:hypothetical protein
MLNVLVMCVVVVTLAEWGSLVATRTLEAPSSQRPKRKILGRGEALEAVRPTIERNGQSIPTSVNWRSGRLTISFHGRHPIQG